MTNYETGKSYEGFVETVYAALLEAERRSSNIKHIQIERRKIITSKSNTNAEIDLYWEREEVGIKHCVAIECKNYNKNIDIGEVRDFADKISGIGGLKGLMVTKIGFSEQAIKRAKAADIDLIIIREQQPEDWDQRIKKVTLRIHALHPARTTEVKPSFDRSWLLENGYKIGDKIQFSCNNDVMIFEDKTDGFKASLLDLENNNFFSSNGYGNHIWERNFHDGWIYFDTKPMKINSVAIRYTNPRTTTQEMAIDFEQYVLAIMEYVIGGEGKYVVLKNGEKKSF